LTPREVSARFFDLRENDFRSGKEIDGLPRGAWILIVMPEQVKSLAHSPITGKALAASADVLLLLAVSSGLSGRNPAQNAVRISIVRLALPG
jgi:hypothetical protein